MSTAPPRRLKVFICHAADDKPIIRELHARLSAEGYEPWMDENALVGGDLWIVGIRAVLESVDLVLVCLSKQSITKTGFVQEEIDIALDFAEKRPDGQAYVIPVLLEKCAVPDRLDRS